MAMCIVLNPADNVGVALTDIPAGTEVTCSGHPLRLVQAIPRGHKFALSAVPRGGAVMKYGVPIGHATADIPAGAHVHVHNVKTNLEGEENYVYQPTPSGIGALDPGAASFFQGYPRPDGRVGIRNEVWVVPAVGCVNWLAETLAREADAMRPQGVDRVVAFPHPYGCSQMGDDFENTRIMLSNLALHPNAGGLLFVGLGCENNVMADFRKLVESRPGANPNIAYMVAQDETDEMAAGCELLAKVMAKAAETSREPFPVAKLCVGMKCGGSDGLSGVTANPLIGAFSDWLVARGGSSILTEVPEMFGAERALLNRAVNEDVFQRGVEMVNGFKNYFLSHNQVVYENPSPGNKDGGITTLEDKSVGCTQKGGSGPVTDVIPYGGIATKPGVTLLAGPGNDLVSISNLAACGAHLVLFSTGRGTPLGCPVPVLKISSNTPLALKKGHWIDFDAGVLATGGSMECTLSRFVELILEIASGKRTRSEEHGLHDFTIFRQGVTV